jgi:hypothetical protein
MQNGRASTRRVHLIGQASIAAFCERFHKTLLDEFYWVTFRTNLYDTPDALQADFDEWMAVYNEQRTQ